jgi:hypothetical protein
MAYVDWMIRGPKISGCSCAYGCPCAFSARPSYEACEGLEMQLIEEGYFADQRLDGLLVGARYRWPGAMHEGGGVAQAIIDKRADRAQRDAVIKILSGEEQEPTTVFNIVGATLEREPHLAIIRLPEGHRFTDAELASSAFTAVGDIAFAHDGCYGYLTHAAYGPQGVIR